jgi:hypothetical protein
MNLAAVGVCLSKAAMQIPTIRSWVQINTALVAMEKILKQTLLLAGCLISPLAKEVCMCAYQFVDSEKRFLLNQNTPLKIH